MGSYIAFRVWYWTILILASVKKPMVFEPSLSLSELSDRFFSLWIPSVGTIVYSLLFLVHETLS